jgi:outer membrane protein OmpA-like peptidoglycan-associated protein
MPDQEDARERIGVWVVLGVVFLVLAGVVGVVTLRSLNAKSDALAQQLAAEGIVDTPLTGELVGKIHFESGLAVLPAGSPALIDRVVRSLREAPGRKVLVAGFHDATGDADRNAALARLRAFAARDALRAAGADPARIVLRKPESTSGDGSLQEARRVELRLVD